MSKASWKQPPKPPIPVLKMRNSLTQELEEFIPMSGKTVNWYICGPTVYTSAHMGHARTYLSFDVIRRIMEDYFNYDVHYAMNITDVEDKIIIGARKTFLFTQYSTANKKLSPEVIQFVLDAVARSIQVLEEKIQGEKTKEEKLAAKGKQKEAEEAASTAKLYEERILALKKSEAPAIEEARKQQEGSSEALLLAFQSPISDLLDEQLGATVTDQKIFRDYAALYEEEFYKDLDSLNIRFPDVVLRVSEFIPHIISFIKKIQENGFAYETSESVYFDTEAFNGHPDHTYAKLLPSGVGNSALMKEGEGELSGKKRDPDRRSDNDFALWKKAKPGEPTWDSPWGTGRPGWHIECSAMAGDTFGSKIDIHSGGIDLKFPHHDNEIAQSEAHYGCDQWVNYFLHSGHLHIKGLKMARSLKNFITIKQALNEYTPRQLRLLFLMQSWDRIMYFEDSAIEEVKVREKTLKEFFLTVQASLRDQRGISQVQQLWGVKERVLYATLKDVEADVHKALCNNFDTSSAMNSLNDLVTKVNSYSMKNASRNALLMKRVAVYITRMLRVFGVISDEQDEFGFPETREGAANTSSVLPSVLDAFTKFRSQVRQGAKDKKESIFYMRLCDTLRDEVMPQLGVRFEDSGDFQWKLESKTDLMRERAAKKMDARDRLEKSKNALDSDIERWTRCSLSSQDRLKALYSQFDEAGTPTHDGSGNPIPKKNAAKFQKEVQKMTQDHQKYLDKIADNPNFLNDLKNKSQDYANKIKEFED